MGMIGNRLKLALTAGALALSLGGCIHEARIAMPSELAAASERIELTGMGGGEHGRMRLGASEGRFVRRAMQGSTDPLGIGRHNYGGGSFDLTGPEVGGTLSSDCRYHEGELSLGVVTLPRGRFAYRCRFMHNGEPLEAGLILEEIPTRPGSFFSGRTRGGEIHIGDEVVTMRAIHDMEGGRIPTGTPLGYMFDIDGRRIGAIDLNGTDKTIFAPRSGSERQAVLAASLALSILWDPME